MRWVALLSVVACSSVDPSASAESDLAGDLATEIKVQIDVNDLGKLGLSTTGGERRDVTFYDTTDLDLFASGVILRSRLAVSSPDDDTTVKLRPLSAKSVDPSFIGESGFKCELDKNVGMTAVSSCSLTKPEPEKDILAVGGGTSSAKSLFSSSQEDFLTAHGKNVSWSSLRVLGPIDGRVWKIDPKNWKSELTVERWIVPGGSTSLEVSLKTRWADHVTEEKRLVAWLAAHGVQPSSQQETKTKAALVALAAQ